MNSAIKCPVLTVALDIYMSLSPENKEHVKPAVEEFKRRNAGYNTDSKAIVQMLNSYNELADRVESMMVELEKAKASSQANIEKMKKLHEAQRILNTPLDWD